MEYELEINYLVEVHPNTKNAFVLMVDSFWVNESDFVVLFCCQEISSVCLDYVNGLVTGVFLYSHAHQLLHEVHDLRLSNWDIL